MTHSIGLPGFIHGMPEAGQPRGRTDRPLRTGLLRRHIGHGERPISGGYGFKDHVSEALPSGVLSR